VKLILFFIFCEITGHSAETSGGLLICLPREQAAAYCKVKIIVIYFIFVCSLVLT